MKVEEVYLVYVKYGDLKRLGVESTMRKENEDGKSWNGEKYEYGGGLGSIVSSTT